MKYVLRVLNVVVSNELQMTETSSTAHATLPTYVQLYYPWPTQHTHIDKPNIHNLFTIFVTIFAQITSKSQSKRGGNSILCNNWT
jgi:hypothetical protein